MSPEGKRSVVNYDPDKFDLSLGTAAVIRGLRRQNPQLTDPEVEELGNAVLSEVGRRISGGEKLAFFSVDDHGKPSLTLLGLEIVKRQDRKLTDGRNR